MGAAMFFRISFLESCPSRIRTLGHDLPIICSASLSFEWLVRILNLPNRLRRHPGYSRRRGSEPSIRAILLFRA
jgi:hypothetical protein